MKHLIKKISLVCFLFGGVFVTNVSSAGCEWDPGTYGTIRGTCTFSAEDGTFCELIVTPYYDCTVQGSGGGEN